MFEQPPPEVLTAFRIAVSEELGGRENKHWKVLRRSETLVLRKWRKISQGSFDFECQAMNALKDCGWAIPFVLDQITVDERIWSLSPFVPGTPGRREGSDEQRATGRLLAEFHIVCQALPPMPQRRGWETCLAKHQDDTYRGTLRQHEHRFPEDCAFALKRLDEAHRLTSDIALELGEPFLIHGDFAPWNLTFVDDKCTGIVDFEIAHIDHRLCDFFLAWRGKYDDVIRGYEEVSPLSEAERAALIPLWWTYLIEAYCDCLQKEYEDDGWLMEKLGLPISQT